MLYKYLFYKLYSWAVYLNLDNTPQYTALVTASVLTCVNLFNLTLLYEIFSKNKLKINEVQGLIIYGVVIIFDYFILIRKKKHLKIATIYAEESESNRKTGNILVWLYIVFSMVTFFVLSAIRNG